MKTLDEVIDSITKQSGLEIRDIKKPDKDRFWVDRETYNDALYYLKEYRSEKIIWESDRKHYEDWIEQYKETRDKHQQAVKEMLKNPPLTWDELQEMEGKPVWIVNERLGWANWEIILCFCDGVMETREDSWNIDEMGTEWNAYRKEN